MSERSYYWWALWTPLLIAGLSAVIRLDSNHPSLVIGAIVGPGMVFALFGAIPYAVFAVAVTCTMWRAPAPTLRRLTVLAPLYLLVLFWLYAALVDIAGGTPSYRFWPTIGAFFGAWVLGIGYTYAAIVEGGHRLWVQHCSHQAPVDRPAT